MTGNHWEKFGVPKNPTEREIKGIFFNKALLSYCAVTEWS
jgi:hypothetical protein